MTYKTQTLATCSTESFGLESTVVVEHAWGFPFPSYSKFLSKFRQDNSIYTMCQGRYQHMKQGLDVKLNPHPLCAAQDTMLE
jgi:hypothetical protein